MPLAFRIFFRYRSANFQVFRIWELGPLDLYFAEAATVCKNREILKILNIYNFDYFWWHPKNTKKVYLNTILEHLGGALGGS